MKQILITGGTNFASRYAADFFLGQGYAVTVLNRNSRPQVPGVTLVEADRHRIGRQLKEKFFDAVLDITAYTETDVLDLLDALDGFENYILVSSSAVYPESLSQPFREDMDIGPNRIWGTYGTDKIAAERALQSHVPDAYILRPPYLYGPGNNVYREAFVFDCAMRNRPFFLPGTGELPLQFFHIADLCRVMEAIITQKPRQRIFNVGNPEPVTARKWAELCYEAAGKTARFLSADKTVEQRQYFPFYDYAYHLDVTQQALLLPEVTHLKEGLREAFLWYQENQALVKKRPLLEFIDDNL